MPLQKMDPLRSFTLIYAWRFCRLFVKRYPLNGRPLVFMLINLPLPSVVSVSKTGINSSFVVRVLRSSIHIGIGRPLLAFCQVARASITRSCKSADCGLPSNFRSSFTRRLRSWSDNSLFIISSSVLVEAESCCRSSAG